MEYDTKNGRMNCWKYLSVQWLVTGMQSGMWRKRTISIYGTRNIASADRFEHKSVKSICEKHPFDCW